MRLCHRGFTLLEVLATLLLLGVAIFALLQLQGQAISDTTKLKRLARAQAAAESAMDEFFVLPDLVPVGTVFDDDQIIDAEGYEEDGFRVRRIISERLPAEDQETFYVNPDDEPDEEAMAAEGDVEEPWDPGTFISVRIDVLDREPSDKVLASLETWVPKPPLEEAESEEGDTSTSSGAGASRQSGSSGRARPSGSSGTTRPPGRSGRSRPSGDMAPPAGPAGPARSRPPASSGASGRSAPSGRSRRSDGRRQGGGR